MYEMIDSNVLCVPIGDDANKSDGGIILPDKIRSKPIRAKIIAVGPGDHLEDGSRCPMTVEVGMVVILLAKGGDKLYIDGRELIAIPEKYITMVLSEPDEEN